MVGHTHWISSLGKEGAVLALGSSVPNIKAVHVPMSGCGVSHVYIQIRKTVEGQGKTAAVAALNGSSTSNMPSCLTRTWTSSTRRKCSSPWPLVSRRIAALVLYPG